MSLNHLKHIPCPAGDHCTAFKCLFQHRGDLKPDDPPPESPADLEAAQSEQLNRRKRAGGALHTSTEPPSKRSRTGAPPDEVVNSPSAAALRQAAPSKDASELVSPSKPASLTRTVSPPPTSRGSSVAIPGGEKDKAQSPTSKPATPVFKIASSSPQTPSPSATTPLRPKPTKPEILNPRVVKPSPSTFETRYKLLLLVHGELTRLNDQLKNSTGTDAIKKDNPKEPQKTPTKPNSQEGEPPRNSNNNKGQQALSDQQLITMALDEEQGAAVARPAIYTTAMRGVFMKYKRMTLDEWKVVCKQELDKELAKTNPHAKTAPTQPKEILTGLTPSQELFVLLRLLTPIDSLANHGYVSSVPEDADIQKAKKGLEMSQGWEKCCRCEKRFQVFPGRREEDGALTSGSSCVHHPGKTYFQEKQPGDKSKQPKRYRCCGEAVGDSAGCTTGNSHVFKVSDAKRLAGVTNFAETPQSEKKIDYGVCFDCEMGYTVYGMELIRVTATSWPTGDELLDVLVRPKGEILDLNSRYSGVLPQDIADAEPYLGTSAANPARQTPQQPPLSQETTRKKFKIMDSPEAARDLLFSFVTPDTPLIGHGLENDLNAMRIVHPTLVDTVLLFPHRLGLPYRHGLKMLAERHLGKHIQVETPGSAQGHDSAEDARTAGELARLKVQQEWERMKLAGWSLKDGEFVAPPGGEKGKDVKEGQAQVNGKPMVSSPGR